VQFCFIFTTTLPSKHIADIAVSEYFTYKGIKRRKMFKLRHRQWHHILCENV